MNWEFSCFDHSTDVISINETKLDETIKSCEVHIPGYEFIRRDRNRQGGGVGFCIKTSINFVQSNPAISNSVNSNSRYFELIVLSLHLKSTPLFRTCQKQSTYIRAQLETYGTLFELMLRN